VLIGRFGRSVKGKTRKNSLFAKGKAGRVIVELPTKWLWGLNNLY
jgi:hypothetical protein